MTASLFDRSSEPGTGLVLDDDGAGDLDGDLDGLLGSPGSVAIDTALDVAGFALALVLAVAVAFDLAVEGRWVLTVAFFSWAPGWAIVRAASIRASSLSLLVSVGVSVSLTMLVGQCLIAWGWSAWRVVTVGVCVAVAAVLARDLRRARP